MSERTPRLLVEDILDSSRKIRQFIAGMSFDQFLHDEKTIDAVVRNFEIIGEASIRLSDDFKRGHPVVDWTRIRGFRNRIVHDYFGIDHSIVWNIIQSYLPELTSELEAVLKGLL